MSTHETPLFQSHPKGARAHPAPNNAGAMLLGLVLLAIVVAALAFGAPALKGLRAQAGCAADVGAASGSCTP